MAKESDSVRREWKGKNDKQNWGVRNRESVSEIIGKVIVSGDQLSTRCIKDDIREDGVLRK